MTGAEKSESISWTVRLSDKAPWKLIVICTCAFFAGGLGMWISGPIAGLSGVLIVMASTADFWLGTRYRIDDVGASSKTAFSLTKMEWSEVRRVVIGSAGIKLSPLADSSRMSAFRGVFLRYGDQSQAELEEAVRSRLNEDVRFVDGGTE